jgi:hypothetical protein
MLFDLRGRGRRRTVQAIYLGLAMIFLLGFVGFGVGVGGSGGGLINALTNNEGKSGANYSSQVAAALKRSKREPRNPAAWAALTEAQLHQASEGEYYDQTNEAYTSKGKELLAKVAASWNTYLALEQRNPSVSLAKQMAGRVFVESGLNQPSAVVQALQIEVAAEPGSAALYGLLAEYSYKAHNTRQGDLASEKAVALAPASERKRVKAQLEAIKLDPNGSSGTTVPSGTYTTTVGGKKTVLKSSGNGTLTSTTPKSGSGQTSSTKK